MAETRRRGRWLAGVGLLAAALAGAAAGCGGVVPAPLEPEPAIVVEVAPITTQSSGDPLEEVALQAAAAGRYEDAWQAYDALGKRTIDPGLRAEFVFLAAESALGAKKTHEALLLYQRLLREYPTTPRYASAVDRVFLIGRLFCLGRALRPSWLGVETEDRELGISVLTKFVEGRERHPRADDALHAIAQAQLELGEWEDAVDSWTQLAREYPASEYAQTAEYRIALTTLSASDGVEYDKGPVEAGRRLLKRYLERFPKGNHAQEAEAKLAEVEQALAAQKLRVARFYLRRDEYYSADVYLAAVLREYPGTPAADEARDLRAGLPRISPPPPPPDPGGLGGEAEDEETNEDRLRLAPAPLTDSW